MSVVSKLRFVRRKPAESGSDQPVPSQPGPGILRDAITSESQLIFLRREAMKFLASVVLVAAATQLHSAESVLWQQFKAATLAGTEPTLPDFSYAGYDYSESPIPDTSGWPVFSITNYGAIADDSGFDDAAIQATIDAAQAAGGGVVFFPAGQFRVSPNTNVGENIFIRGSNILLKGSGSTSGGTEIFMVNMKVNNGRYIFEVKPTSTAESPITTVISNAPRESYEVEVADASSLGVNDRVIVRCTSVPYAEAYYAPQTLDPAWTRLTSTSGFNMRELHTVESIDGNTVRFREPLHLPMITEHGGQPINIEVRTYNVLTNVGVEDIRFKGNWDSHPESFVHHQDAIHDYAWDALRFDNVANGWLRDCEFEDWNQCVYFDGCAAFTVSNVLFTGKKGHASIHTRRCYGILVRDCQDTAGHHHGCGVGYWNCGTVYLRHQLAGGQRIDSHSGSPYATLLDGVSGGHFDGNGGPHESYPHHARDFVAWNFNVSGGPDNYNFWPSSRNGHTFALPTLVGLQGKSVTFSAGTITTNESPGVAAEPASLFEAQLQFRLSPDKDEDGLEDDWELAYFDDLTTTAGLESEDYDGDRFIDRHEYLAGTVPTNHLSLLELEGVSVSTDQGTKDVLLSWQAVTGKSYRITGNTNLNSGWETVASGILATNTPGTYELQTEAATMFFKISLE